jgi:poly-beta-1,6-N-acetyl-D-glucosamine N-deacetylase
MHTLNYIQKTKVIFSVCMLVIIGISSVGIMALENNIYITNRYLLSLTDYFKYSFEFYRNSGVAQAASSGYVYTGNTEVRTYERELADSVPVLVYHRIVKKPDGFNVTEDSFKEQMFALKREGYITVSLKSLLEFMRDEKDLPTKSVVITFDDGSKDSFYNVDPLLRVLGFRAVNFVISGHSVNTSRRDSYYLNEQELIAMAASGRWDIGSHTDSGHGQVMLGLNGETGNFLSNRMWLAAENRLETVDEYKERIHNDLVQSKQKLENRLGTQVLGFAFPYGDYGFDSRNVPGDSAIIKKMVTDIFPMSFFQPSGKDPTANTPSKDPTLYIKRMTVRPDWTADNLIDRLTALQ